MKFPELPSRALALVFSLALALLSSGCATIVKDDSQPVAFSSDPQGATILINGTPRGQTPTTIMVKRSAKKQMIQMEMSGYETEMFPLGKSVAGMTFGNIIFGGLIGVGVDIATGKATNYEESVHVKLRPRANLIAASKTQALPAETPTARTGVSAPRATIIEDTPAVANNGLGLVVEVADGGIRVAEAKPDSAASAAGIAPGDEIVIYNEVRVSENPVTVAAAINAPLSNWAKVSWKDRSGRLKTAKLEW